MRDKESKNDKELKEIYTPHPFSYRSCSIQGYPGDMEDLMMKREKIVK